MNRSSSISPDSSERGMALPVALFLLLIMSAVGAIYSDASKENLRTLKLREVTSDNFYVAEGAANTILSSMAISPHLWREKAPVAATPLAYVEYDPKLYTLSNGIPTCTGSAACQRNMYPVGGGLIKNVGPIGGDGDVVNTAKKVINQVNSSAPPTPDITLNNNNAWTQVERLDQLSISSASLGGELSNNPQGGALNVVRFRVTGIAERAVRKRVGRSTVVMTVEMPPG